MPDAEEITLSSSGTLPLAVRAWGASDAPPLLALHGWLDNAATFDALAPRLDARRVLALDLPGHGRSAHRPRGTHYHFVDYVADTVAAADALGLARFALMGHSLGANVACFVAATVPERIRCLALLEGFGPLSGDPGAGPAQLRESLEQMRALSRKRLPLYRSLEEAARARQQAGDFGFDAALTLTRRGARACEGGYTWRSDPALRVKSPQYLGEEQVLGYLRAIEAPTLLVRASRGLPVRRKAIEQRYRHVRQLEIFDVDGGHHVHLENAAPVAAALNEFLARH